MDAEGFEEEESPLEGLVTGKFASQIRVQTFGSGTIFESLHLTEVKLRRFPLTFGMFRSKIIVRFRKIFVLSFYFIWALKS